MSSSRKFLSIAFVFLAFSGGAVFFFYALRGTPAELQQATNLPAPMPLPAFSLVDHNGEAFTRDSLRGGWHLVFFGFTNCPDICPATLQQLAIVNARLAESGQETPDIVLISVDPERDTAEAMASYVNHFDANIKGVTGAVEELRALTGPLGIFFARSGDLEGNYSVDHSSVVLLINPAAEWQALFSAPHNIDSFVNDIPILTGAT